MVREGKGQSAGKYMDDYAVIDLETTDYYVGMAEIVEISAIRVRDNMVVEEFSTLVNPHCPIPERAMRINHITDEMVKDAPDLEEVIDSFIEFVGDDVVVGYNIASFDMCLIYDVLKRLRDRRFSNNYIDVMHAAKRCLADMDNYKLETISRFYGLDTEGEHRALKDCYLVKDVYDRLYAKYGEEAFEKRSDSKYQISHNQQELISLRALKDMVEVIIEDGKVTLDELSELKFWVREHRELAGNYPFDRVFCALDKLLEDRDITQEELDELLVILSDLVDPVKNRGSHNVSRTIQGKHVVVTGDFAYGSRKAVQCLIETAGGIIDKTVKTSTNYVVVGANGSRNWKAGNYGQKIHRAVEMKDKGYDIDIVEEAGFIPAVKRFIECSIEEETSDKPDKADRAKEGDNAYKEYKHEEGDNTVEAYIAYSKGHLAALEMAGQEKCVEMDSSEIINLDWKREIRDMLESLIDEYGLPSGSLYLSDNYGHSAKHKDTITSHTVYIWEPDYPPAANEKPGKNKSVVTITPESGADISDTIVLNLREVQEGDLHKILPDDAEVLKRTKADMAAGMVRIRIKKTSPSLIAYIRENTVYCLKGYVSKAARFGCCSMFEKCSDEGKCVHENQLYSKACIYRNHLEQGRVFYGKNRNID